MLRLNEQLSSCAMLLLSGIVASFAAADEFLVCKTDRNAEEQGFHRKVSTRVDVDLKQVSLLDARPCDLQLVEHLPAGAFVDVYEIRATSELKVSTDSVVDVEKPQHRSDPLTVRVFSVLRPSAVRNSSAGVVWRAEVTLPVHLRYHRPARQDSEVLHGATVRLDHPEVLVRCVNSIEHSGPTIKAPCDSSSGKPVLCDWMKLSCGKSQLEALEFRVPVGSVDDTILVAFVTGACVVTVILLLTVAMYNDRFTTDKCD